MIEPGWRDKLDLFRNDGSCEDVILKALSKLADANQLIREFTEARDYWEVRVKDAEAQLYNKSRALEEVVEVLKNIADAYQHEFECGSSRRSRTAMFCSAAETVDVAREALRRAAQAIEV